MKEWIQSESVTLEYIGHAIKWLQAFYDKKTSLFQIYVSSEDTIEPVESINTASAHIATALQHQVPQLLSRTDRANLEPLLESARAVSQHLAEAELKDVLPIASFGLLPLFSTCYRVRCVDYYDRALSLMSYAIMIRRLLFEISTRQLPQWAHIQTMDQLHPFLLFHCANSLCRLKDILAQNKDNQKLRATFVKNLQNQKKMIQALTACGISKDEIDQVLGTGGEAPEFQTHYLAAIIGNDEGSGPSLVQAMKWIEDASLNAAVSEVARSNDADGWRADPSSLAFALLTLSSLNPHRHDAIISQGMRLALDRCQHGSNPAAVPFYIDDKGRALFVPSVEIANAILSLALNRIEKISDADLNHVLTVTRQVQDRLIEEYNEIEAYTKDKQPHMRYGWCSDRAPSSHRIDSWVTAEVLVFLYKHLELLQWAKRRFVLAQYSWTPHRHVSPSWDKIVDPDLGLSVTGVKQTIEEVMDLQGKSLETAPMFLLYGPPGTSKTTIASGLAKKMGWDLVTLSPSDFVSESLDRIEHRARKIFQELMNLDRCVILLDELDALMRQRESFSHGGAGNIMEFVIPALLPKIQQLRDYTIEHNMAVFFASNYYEKIDRALSRPGRIDTHILVLPYSNAAQLKVATQIILARQPSADIASYVKTLTVIFGHLPRCFVYRDIERIVTAVLANKSEAEIIEYAATMGIQPETYDPETRLPAYREFCAFVSARLSKKPADWRQPLSLSREDARRYLQDSTADLTEAPAWRQVVEKWPDVLG